MGRIRSSFKWGIFLSSYVPLYLILSYKHLSVQTKIPVVVPVLGGIELPLLTIFWILLSLASLVMLRFVFTTRKSKEPDPREVKNARTHNDAITKYILVYIFPFVVLDYTSLANWIAFITFFIVIGIIQVRSNQLYVNPILGLLGYDLYEVDTENEKFTLLTNRRLENRPTRVPAVELSNGVYLSVKEW